MRAMMAFLIVVALLGCGGESGERKSKVREAVEEVVTQEFKTYDRAKGALERIEKQSQERRDAEKEAR